MATYRFFPPVVEEGPMALHPPFLHRFRLPKGVSLVWDGASYVERRYLAPSEHMGKTEGDDYFLGGYRYSNVPQDIADRLIASGYEDGLEEE